MPRISFRIHRWTETHTRVAEREFNGYTERADRTRARTPPRGFQRIKLGQFNFLNGAECVNARRMKRRETAPDDPLP